MACASTPSSAAPGHTDSSLPCARLNAVPPCARLGGGVLPPLHTGATSVPWCHVPLCAAAAIGGGTGCAPWLCVSGGRIVQDLPVGSTFERLLRLTAPDGGLHLANTVDNSGPGASPTYNADTMRNVTIKCSEDEDIVKDLVCLGSLTAADSVSQLCAEGALDNVTCANAAPPPGDSSPLPVWLVATIASGALLCMLCTVRAACCA